MTTYIARELIGAYNRVGATRLASISRNKV